MRLKLIIVGVLIIIFAQCQCIKKPEVKNENESNYMSNDNNTGIDFDAMKRKIDESKQMDIDVFFAISVLHKKYISQFAEETASMTEEEQKKFYNDKKVEFFKTIKYTENEYENFMKTHLNEMNEYINNHKAIADYLISIN